jgi:hypothetical protein
MHPRASDGSPLLRPYTKQAELEAPRLMARRQVDANDTAAGLARLKLVAATQEVSRAQAKLADARVQVDEADTARLATVLRQALTLRPDLANGNTGPWGDAA